MSQQLFASRMGAMSYGRQEQVAAGQIVELCRFRAPESGEVVGLSIGLGISDVTQWGAAFFTLSVNGVKVAEFRDQISDLLRPEFVPLAIPPKAEISLAFTNGSTAALDAAAIVRAEVIPQ